MIRSDRTYAFPADPPTIWERLGQLEHYRFWWPWLRHFEAERLEAGEVWGCTIKPPVPWSIRIDVRITDAEAPRRIAARVTGEVTGDGQLDIRPTASGSELRIRTNLAPASPVLRAAALLAAPLSRFGHDWVLDTGSRQFRENMKA